MSRIPSGVVFIRQSPVRCGLVDDTNARLWPVLPQQLKSRSSHHTLHQQLKKYPTRLRVVHAPSSKSSVNVVMYRCFHSWFPNFHHDPNIFLPQLICWTRTCVDFDHIRRCLLFTILSRLILWKLAFCLLRFSLLVFMQYLLLRSLCGHSVLLSPTKVSRFARPWAPVDL